MLRLPSGHTLLLAQSIDPAPRIDAFRTGDSIAFADVDKWNPQGGLIHWTHRDPDGRRRAGWLKYAGITYP